MRCCNSCRGASSIPRARALILPLERLRIRTESLDIMMLPLPERRALTSYRMTQHLDVSARLLHLQQSCCLAPAPTLIAPTLPFPTLNSASEDATCCRLAGRDAQTACSLRSARDQPYLELVPGSAGVAGACFRAAVPPHALGTVPIVQPPRGGVRQNICVGSPGLPRGADHDAIIANPRGRETWCSKSGDRTV